MSFLKKKISQRIDWKWTNNISELV